MLSSRDKAFVCLPDLLEGEVDLGYGVRVSPVLSGGQRKRLVALRMSHDIQDYGETTAGVCSKVIPIKQARRVGKRRIAPRIDSTHWALSLDDDQAISLWPSIACDQHSIHGYIEDGFWQPMRERAFRWCNEEEYQRRIRAAEDEIREFGGGYEGAVLALASKKYSLYGGPPLHLGRGREIKPREPSRSDLTLPEATHLA